MKLSLSITNLQARFDLAEQGPVPLSITCSSINAELEAGDDEPQFNAWRTRLEKAITPLADKMREMDRNIPPDTPPTPPGS